MRESHGDLPTVRVDLLTDLAVTVDGAATTSNRWRRRDAATLVKVLALTGHGRMHREQVLDTLWPDLGVEDAAPRLHKAAHYARRAAGHPDAVVLRDDLVLLFPGFTTTVDADQWETSATQALDTSDEDLALTLLDQLPTEPLQQDMYSEWAAPTRERLGVMRRRLLRLLGRWQELLRLDPTDEEAHIALMQQHVAAGDRTAALAQFEQLDQALRDELGTSASPAATRLRDEVLQNLSELAPLTPAEDARVGQRIAFCHTPDDVSIAYAVTGKVSGRPPLVKAANWLTHLDHDWHSPVWSHWITELSQRRELIRYDERGCGLSDWHLPHEQMTFESWVQDLETVVDDSGNETVDLLGISQGGAVAVAYAVRHPERVRRLVLYGAFAQGRLVRSASDEERQLNQAQIELARVGWGQDTAAFRQVFTTQFMPHASKELWEAFNDLQKLTASPENAAHYLSVSGHIDVTTEARRVTAPTLVLHARNEHRIPFAQGRRLATLIPGSRFVALESENHILLADEPAWPVFLSEVNDFLET